MTIECYSYRYCVGGSGICMLNLCCCIRTISGTGLPQRSKSWAKLLSLPSSCRSQPDLAEYCIVWATFSRYFLLNALLLIVSAYIRDYGHFLANYKLLQQLDCEENWIYAYRIYQFSQNDHPSRDSSNRVLWLPLLLSVKMHASWKSYHNPISETKTSLADWAFHHYLAKILMMQ